MKEMHENGLDISIQRKLISYKKIEQGLSFENFSHTSLEHRRQRIFTLNRIISPKKLHNVFGHPSVFALNNLLKRANLDRKNSKLRKEIEKIVKQCEKCLKYGHKPKSLKIAIGTENLKFNHIIAAEKCIFLEISSILWMKKRFSAQLSF